MTTSAVISLVIEAIGTAMSERREYSTEECVASSTSAALERSAGSASEARRGVLQVSAHRHPRRTAACETAATSSRQVAAVSLKQRP